MQKLLIAGVIAFMFGHAGAAESSNSVVVTSADKKSGITLELHEGWKTFHEKDGATTIEVPKSGVHIQVWALSQTLIEDSIKQVPDLIKSQVTNFKLTETKSADVAGAAGKLLIGTGEEADDGDPSNSEVYLFTVEGKVYMICAHGEGDVATKSRPILPGLLASVKAVKS